MLLHCIGSADLYRKCAWCTHSQRGSGLPWHGADGAAQYWSVVGGRRLYAASLAADALFAPGERCPTSLQWSALLHKEHHWALQWRAQEEVALLACRATVNHLLGVVNKRRSGQIICMHNYRKYKIRPKWCPSAELVVIRVEWFVHDHPPCATKNMHRNMNCAMIIRLIVIFMFWRHLICTPDLPGHGRGRISCKKNPCNCQHM